MVFLSSSLFSLPRTHFSLCPPNLYSHLANIYWDPAMSQRAYVTHLVLTTILKDRHSYWFPFYRWRKQGSERVSDVFYHHTANKTELYMIGKLLFWKSMPVCFMPLLPLPRSLPRSLPQLWTRSPWIKIHCFLFCLCTSKQHFPASPLVQYGHMTIF